MTQTRILVPGCDLVASYDFRVVKIALPPSLHSRNQQEQCALGLLDFCIAATADNFEGGHKSQARSKCGHLEDSHITLAT